MSRKFRKVEFNSLNKLRSFLMAKEIGSKIEHKLYFETKSKKAKQKTRTRARFPASAGLVINLAKDY